MPALNNQNTDTHLALLDQSISHITHTLNRIDLNMLAMKNEINDTRKDITSARADLVSQFRWIITFLFALLASPYIHDYINYLNK